MNNTQGSIPLNVLTVVLSVLLTFFFTLFGTAINSALSRYRKRRVNHYNSLIFLETQLIDSVGIIEDNIYLVPDFKKTTERGDISWSRLKIIHFEDSFLNDLQDLELKNQIHNLLYQIRRINDDLSNLLNAYDEVKEAYIHKFIPVEQYVENLKGLRGLNGQLELIKHFLTSTSEKEQELLAIVAVQIKKDRPTILRLLKIKSKSSVSTIKLSELENERKRIKLEVEESARNSIKEREKILNKIK